MGLDGYLFRRGKSPKAKLVYSLKEQSADQISYWRKNYEVNELFLGFACEEQYFEKGDDLNCQEIILSKEDLKEILRWFEENNEEGLEDVKKCIEETNFENEEVFYVAWW